MKRVSTFGIVALAAGFLVTGALAAPAKTAVKPSNTSPPTMTGSTSVGDTVTADHGNWAGSTPISYQYQWRRCDVD